MNITIPTPNRQWLANFDWLRFAGALLLVVAAAVAGANQWLQLPDVSMLGGFSMIAVSAAAAIGVVMLLKSNDGARKAFGGILAFVAGMLAQPFWKGIGEFVDTLSWAEVGGLLIGLVVAVLSALWLAKR